MSPRFTRRTFLAGVSASTLGLAGCASNGAVEALGGRSFDSLVSGVTVEAREVVIELDSRDVTEVVLIGPDGTAFDSQAVTTGVSTVRFPIIELDLELSTSSHYTPGEYELIAVVDEAEFSKKVMIAPDLRISAVEQYREGDSPTDFARISFSVENVGTGPTWIYDITFDNAPNYSADGILLEEPAIPYVRSPTTASGLILEPGEEQQYLCESPPLTLPESTPACGGPEQNFVATLGVADKNHIDVGISARFDGESDTIALTEKVVCTDVSLDQTGISEES